MNRQFVHVAQGSNEVPSLLLECLANYAAELSPLYYNCYPQTVDMLLHKNLSQCNNKYSAISNFGEMFLAGPVEVVMEGLVKESRIEEAKKLSKSNSDASSCLEIPFDSEFDMIQSRIN
ncbi:hypothetical protein GIB67_029151 [Kingdonia uniflora]|uniref:Uncharacterized protein n=1 Tax=Kingdonia uniflora TaxID=39325 RepID=A0A7J7N3L4_9MAGN|nr:hypothetical protein GIB67_029151 [Kingdonia uniflora]